jgi:hypothetical protein
MLRRASRLVFAVMIAGGTVALWALPGSAATDQMTFRARLDGAPLNLSSSGDPIVLKPDRTALLTLNMVNHGSEPAVVRHVRLRGTAFGITLLSYDFTINSFVPGGGRQTLTVPVQFVDLGQQSDGLLPASMTLLSPDGTELAQQDFTVDVQGSPGSLMVIFTAIITIATLFSVATIWLAVVRRGLPPNRLRRGIRLGVTGMGVGVSLTLLLSVLLFVPPKGSVWIPLILIPAGAAFALGFFSPGPLSMDEHEDEEEDWMRATVPMEAPVSAPA